MATHYFKCVFSGNILTLVDPSDSDLESMQGSVKSGDYVKTSKAEADKATKTAADRAALAKAKAEADEVAKAETERKAQEGRAVLLAMGTAAKEAGLLEAKPQAVVSTPADPEVIAVAL